MLFLEKKEGGMRHVSSREEMQHDFSADLEISNLLPHPISPFSLRESIPVMFLECLRKEQNVFFLL